jgi:putative ABC transport system permease protein
MSAYVNIDRLNRVMREGPTVSGALLFAGSPQPQVLYKELKSMPAIGSVVLKYSIIESFNRTLAQNSMIGSVVLITFASVIAFAAVYNFSRIALSERGRELASLRVLGFTRSEVTGMLVGEQTLLVVASIPLGLVLGYQIALLLARIYSWELFRIPVVIARASYAVCILSIAASAVISAFIVRLRINRMPLVTVIKTRE